MSLPRSRGHSLIEMLTSCVLVTFTFGSVAMTWHLLVRVDQRTNESIAETRQVERLAFRLRLDAREAIRASQVNPSPPSGAAPEAPADVTPLTGNVDALGEDAPRPLDRGWDFELADGRVIEFRIVPQGIARTVRLESVVKHRDLFRLPTSTVVKYLPADVFGQNAGQLSFFRRGPEHDRSHVPIVRDEYQSLGEPWLVVQVTFGPVPRAQP